MSRSVIFSAPFPPPGDGTNTALRPRKNNIAIFQRDVSSDLNQTALTTQSFLLGPTFPPTTTPSLSPTPSSISSPSSSTFQQSSGSLLSSRSSQSASISVPQTSSQGSFASSPTSSLGFFSLSTAPGSLSHSDNYSTSLLLTMSSVHSDPTPSTSSSFDTPLLETPTSSSSSLTLSSLPTLSLSFSSPTLSSLTLSSLASPTLPPSSSSWSSLSSSDPSELTMSSNTTLLEPLLLSTPLLSTLESSSLTLPSSSSEPTFESSSETSLFVPSSEPSSSWEPPLSSDPTSSSSFFASSTYSEEPSSSEEPSTSWSESSSFFPSSTSETTTESTSLSSSSLSSSSSESSSEFSLSSSLSSSLSLSLSSSLSSSETTSEPESSSSSSSATSSELHSITLFTSDSSEYAGYYSTVSVLPDTTITTLVAVPTSADNSDSGGGTSQRNAKLIGGLVGSIGGTILIGSLVVLFLFLKKRRSRVTNHSPDFADDTSGDSNEKSGFKKLFGIGAGGAAGAATVDSYNDLEKHLESRAAVSDPFLGGGVGGHNNAAHDTSDDFAYRGVSNSNNLDSIFHGSGTATGGNSNDGTGGLNLSSASNRGPGHSRMNSDVNRMDTMPEHSYDYDQKYALMGATHVRERLSEFEDEDLFFQAHNHAPLLEGENHSNNSRLRFFEEI